ncbi:related to wd-repeat protein 5 [Ustilago trichophora]|uniref:Related to wd-repeat protein 5 n=1 Tax=Ustilago trichophora TaxID=86804 RepID=A0A5C3EKH7_9BASI|nr:related to wd-repeat protein 5 [Ustilago trichophora]
MAIPLPEESSIPSSSPSSSSSAPDLIYTLSGHTKSPTSLCFSPCGRLLATASSDSTIKLWTVATGTLIHTFTSSSFSSSSSGINDICFSSDSHYLASCSDDRSIKIYSTLTFHLVRTFSEHTSYVLCLAYNPTSTLLVSGSFDETVRLWNVARSKCHRVISAHSEAVTGVDFNSDGTMIVSSSYDGSIRLWDTTTGACLKTLVHKDQSPLGGVQFTPSSAQILCSSLDNTVRMWDVYNSKIVKTYTGHNNSKLPLTARLTFLPVSLPNSTSSATTIDRDGGHDRGASGSHNNKAVMIGGEDGKVTIWHLQSKQIVTFWQAHSSTSAVVATATHPSLNVVATAGVEPDCCVKMWLFSST